MHAFGAEMAGEGTAAPGLALDPAPRLVQLQHVLDDRKAEPGAAGFARATGGNAVEALGDPREVRSGDAVTAVLHRQHCAAVGAARKTHGDAAAGRSVTHRIRD